ncbi:helix-turn-helix transcriptional regulator [Dactylosporangium salmoneum]|uniref:XRE family transcriptional regulator n=1 Tax=Dactylosporangium salmoneum TaxID=53361 RepID=A0ABP5SP50_9ACTN
MTELGRVLRDGPFSTALAVAVERSGLTLDRLRERLAERGVTVSRTTLSYWRSGRSRPERAGSLDAVTALEDVLGLPRASLLVLLGPRRARGRWLDHPQGTLTRHTLWPDAGPMLDHLAAPREGEVVTRSVHDVLRLGPERSERALRVRLVVEASAEQCHRLPVFYQVDSPERDAPRLARVHFGGRGGRSVYDHRTGLMVAEVLFDRPLRRGELAVVDYELEFPPGGELCTYHRRFFRPVREHVIVVEFGPRPPARCHRFTQRVPGGPERPDGEVWIGGTGAAQSVWTDLPPGITGLRWDWS